MHVKTMLKLLFQIMSANMHFSVENCLFYWDKTLLSKPAKMGLIVNCVNSDYIWMV